MELSDEEHELSTQRSYEKRKISIADEIPRKKAKLESKKIKPPTAEEINRLRETENLFHSNLFRMQIEETLKEVIPKHATIERINSFVRKLIEFFLSVESCASSEIFTQEGLFHIPDVVPPMKMKSNHSKTVFNFEKPKSVQVFGSYGIGCFIKNFTNIDIAIEMPKNSFLKNDFLNEKYLQKRNYYLSYLASKLLNSAKKLLVDPNMQFTIRHCVDKPILLVKSSEEKLEKYNFLIYVIPEEGAFKESRFSPTHNNVRYNWYFDTNNENEKMNSPTPYYNSVLCQDLVALRNEEVRIKMFSNNQNFKDAFVLLKLWLHERKLDEGIGCFTSYLVSMFMVYLYNNRRLNHHMSSYHVIRNVWLALDQTNWHKDGISLHELGADRAKILQLFQSAYDVTFIDATGNFNLAALMNLNTYLTVKAESKYAMDCLDNHAVNLFPALFTIPVSFIQQYDQILRINTHSEIEKTVAKHGDVRQRLDLRNDIYTLFSKLVIDMIQKTLNSRITHIFCYIEPLTLSWSIGEKIPRWNNITIGLKIDPEHAYNVIDKGPIANLPEAAEFRNFWGSKAELRRFKDGDVCETVPWANTKDSMKQKRQIVPNIVQYVLENKFGITNEHYIYVYNEVETAIYNELERIFNSKGTGEEVTLDILSSLNQLSKELRELNDLPLTITSIQGISPVFRYTEPIPVISNISSNVKKSTNLINGRVVFKLNRPVKYAPLYVPAIEVVIQFSLTNKWPEDLKAIRGYQTAFYIELSKILSKKYDYFSRPQTSYLDVVKNGYVFRLKISNNNEIAATKRVNEEGVIGYNDNEESMFLERKFIQLPTLTSSIHGLHQQFPAFGASCCISKRWIRCHLIDDYHFPDICIDLLIAHLFLYPQPYMTTHQPQTVFLRFLKMLSLANWYNEPVVVNFNNELTREDITEIDSNFNDNRSNLPPLYIVTPFDKSGVTWTRKEPSFVILNRLSKLAEAALRSIEKSLFCENNANLIQQIFIPPLKGYDIIINIKSSANSLRWMSMGLKIKPLAPLTPPSSVRYPIVEFHPVQQFVNKLREHYEQQCIFLYDFYGGNVIGVVFKPDILPSINLKMKNRKCSNLKNETFLNVDALIDSFYILGEGLVSNIKRCNKNT